MGILNGGPTLENSLKISQKLKHTYCMTQQFYSRHIPKEMKIYSHTNTCTQMFTEVLITLPTKVHLVKAMVFPVVMGVRVGL